VILVDTSVWISHLRAPSKLLAELLDLEQVVIHPFVVGELSCGNLVNRKEIIALLHSLPAAPKAEDDEILFFIERYRLMGRGLGLVDVHLLASSTMTGGPIWTADKNLRLAAGRLGIEFVQHPAAD
jgi:predicted nucleic acid-binding protein